MPGRKQCCLTPRHFGAAKIASGTGASISPRVKKMLRIVKTNEPIGATLLTAGCNMNEGRAARRFIDLRWP